VESIIVQRFLYCIKSLIIDCNSSELKLNFYGDKLRYLLSYLEYAIETNRLLLFFIPEVKEKIFYLLNELRFESNLDSEMISEINNLIVDLNDIETRAMIKFDPPSCKDKLPNINNWKANYNDCSYLGTFIYFEGFKRDLFTLIDSGLTIEEEPVDNSLINIGKVYFLGYNYTGLAKSVMLSMYNDSNVLANIVLGQEDNLRYSLAFLNSVNALLSDYTFLFQNDKSLLCTIQNIINYSLDNVNQIPNKKVRKIYRKCADKTLSNIKERFSVKTI
jgi:hypothetical protein